MRQLRFVCPADDGTHLVVETDDGSEQFRLRYDARLQEVTRLDVAHRTPSLPAVTPIATSPAPTPVPAALAVAPAAHLEVGPREIQVRIRAGESPQELADSLGVPVHRVLRFAAPVMGERLRIADEARRARAHRSAPQGTESKVVVFGEAVDERFTAHGIVAADVAWDSRRRDDGEWIIVAGWLGGEGRHTAEWLFHRSSRSVTALDDTATDLLSDRPIRPVTPPASAQQRPSLAAAPPLRPGVVAFPAFADAQTGPLPMDPGLDQPDFDQSGPDGQDVFDQEAPQAELTEPGQSAERSDEPAPPLVPADADEGIGGLRFEAPPLPLAIIDPSTRPGAGGAGLAELRNLNSPKHRGSGGGESEDDRAARARVPSWDDILLGVRRKQD